MFALTKNSRGQCELDTGTDRVKAAGTCQYRRECLAHRTTLLMNQPGSIKGRLMFLVNQKQNLIGYSMGNGLFFG